LARADFRVNAVPDARPLTPRTVTYLLTCAFYCGAEVRLSMAGRGRERRRGVAAARRSPRWRYSTAVRAGRRASTSWTGRVRVSTLDQNPDRQLDGLRLDRTFTDKASGRDVARPKLAELLRFVRDGDTVVVHSLDRLGRNLDDLRRLVGELTGRGVQVEFAKEQLVFSGEDSPMAHLLLSVMGAFAEFERALIRERQREGIALARQRGAYRGAQALADFGPGR